MQESAIGWHIAAAGRRALLGRVSAINAVAYGVRPLGAAAGFLIQAVVIPASPVPRLARSPLPAAHDPS